MRRQVSGRLLHGGVQVKQLKSVAETDQTTSFSALRMPLSRVSLSASATSDARSAASVSLARGHIVLHSDEVGHLPCGIAHRRKSKLIPERRSILAVVQSVTQQDRSSRRAFRISLIAAGVRTCSLKKPAVSATNLWAG
jgi:hypothetical protein